MDIAPCVLPLPFPDLPPQSEFMKQMGLVPAEDPCGRLIRGLLNTCSVSACFSALDKDMSLYRC
jgi:hypothetical protein